MPLNSDQQAALAAALNRVFTFYDGDHDYNAAMYPGAFRNGGSVINFYPALKDAATIMQLASVLVADAVAASGASPKALRVDNAQSFASAEIAQALINIGLLADTLPLSSDQKTKILSNLGAAAILAAAVQKTGDAMTGDLTTTGRFVAGVGQAASYIEMRDTDEGTRYIHNNSGNIGFLGSAQDWIFQARDNGTVWTKQLGDLASYVNSVGTNNQNAAVNRCVTSTRMAYVGDQSVAANFGGGMHEDYGASWISGRATALSNDQQDIVINSLRWRQLQQYIPNQGWVASYYA